MEDRYLLLSGRPVYHVTPIHRLPSILYSRALLSQRHLGYSLGRITARRRDRALSVDFAVHCSLSPVTPLLKDKLTKGFPHVVLEFDSAGFEGLDWSLLPCNTKAWRSKWQCRPVKDYYDVARYLRIYDEGRRFQGVEILVQDALPLTSLTKLVVFDRTHVSIVIGLLSIAKLPKSIEVVLESSIAVGKSNEGSTAEVDRYLVGCLEQKKCLTPPNVAFD